MSPEMKVEIGTSGIKRALKKYEPETAIAEYVWNGFDAGAKTVNIEIESNELGFISELRIIDDGTGIPRDKLDTKFKPIFHTNRIIEIDDVHRGPSAFHGKNGFGRLTFFTFADLATWETVYNYYNSRFRHYEITINSDRLNTYDAGQETDHEGPTRTIVHFQNLAITKANFNQIIEFLKHEFAWFLELKAPYERSILIDGKLLNYRDFIADSNEFEINVNDYCFSARYIRWQDRLRNEYSRYYFIASDGNERAKKTTLLNNKGDGFFHSIYVKSDYFDNFHSFDNDLDEINEKGQLPLISMDLKRDEVFRELLNSLEEYLHEKRRPFLRKKSFQFVKDLEKGGLLPEFGEEVWEQYRKNELNEVVRDVFEADPRIFSGLTDQQTRTIVQLFCLIMDSSERDSLLEVLNQVINLNKQEREDLAELLQAAQLSNVISTIKLIEDRFVAVDELKKLIFNKDYGANERDHLQTHIERHFWLFGENYHLVTKQTADFEKALRNYLYILRGENKDRSVDHIDKNKRMDIFAVRELRDVHEIHNIVLEIKHPSIKLGRKEFEQVQSYFDVILSQADFNASNMQWEFFLVGSDYDTQIELVLENGKPHGERHLAFKVSNYKIYILTWREVINNFELRHNFLYDKLKLERDKLVTEGKTADEILLQGSHNSAILDQ